MTAEILTYFPDPAMVKKKVTHHDPPYRYRWHLCGYHKNWWRRPDGTIDSIIQASARVLDPW